MLSEAISPRTKGKAFLTVFICQGTRGLRDLESDRRRGNAILDLHDKGKKSAGHAAALATTIQEGKVAACWLWIRAARRFQRFHDTLELSFRSFVCESHRSAINQVSDWPDRLGWQKNVAGVAEDLC